MKLKDLQLHNFRSYQQKNFTFTKITTVFLGQNAIGKTNILEAVTLLATGKSFRAQKDEEMITFDEEFSRISGEVDGTSLEVVLSRGIWQGKKVAKKRFLVNGVGKRRQDFLSNLRVVLFEPQDIELIIGSPGKRRDYLNFVLSQVDLEYNRSLLSYQKGLRQRNKLLSLIAEKKATISQLEFWNRLLLKNGEIIRQKRDEYLGYLNKRYEAASEEFPSFTFIYQPNVISPQRLITHQEAEIATGITLIGPHRDNFEVFQGVVNQPQGKNLTIYGSRGEQRMAILALKMGELEFITQATGERPLLLLDDIFSELDSHHQEVILTTLKKQQSLITATELPFSKDRLGEAEMIKLGTA